MPTNKQILVWLVILSGSMIGCSTHSSGDPFADEKFDAFDDSLGQRVIAYHQKVFSMEKGKKEGKPSLYIDFSSGIYEALSQPANKEMLNAIYDNLSGGVDVFKLGNDSILSFADKDLILVGKQVMEKGNYKEPYAPIRKAVEDIVSKKNDAILITDFEAYYPGGVHRPEITNVAYLKEPFINWLAHGNSIHFFISDYQEKSVTKHLYFTVFNYGALSGSSLFSRIKNSVPDLAQFDLSNQPIIISSGYGSEKNGGIFYDPTGKSEKAINILDMDREKYINGGKLNMNFEFYPFGLNWETIAKEKEAYNGQMNDFFRKLFIDISNRDSYQIDGLSVRVSDVTKDFERFARCQEVLKHNPLIVKGSNGENKFADTEKDPIALGCYNADGSIKGEWLYQPQSNPEIPDFFTFNKKLFDNTLKNSERKKVEVAVSFDPKFNFKNIPTSARLLRVDVMIDKVAPSISGEKIDKFSWQSITQKAVANSALSSSITNTLTDLMVKPEHRVIYSYYIKTIEN